MRIFAWSDLHVDHPRNRSKVEQVSRMDHVADVLLLAGDVSDDMDRLAWALEELRARFEHVFFVPGNHELWVRGAEEPDSLRKFERVLDRCESLDVATRPRWVGRGEGATWIVPLFSWYTKPEEGPDSLFLEKPGEDPSLRMWADEYHVRWPDLEGGVTPARWFLGLNEPFLEEEPAATVVSLSHFLPRADLMFTSAEERRAGRRPSVDRSPRFNFSRVAGSARIEDQLRRIGSTLHVYGHQHRNRDREVDGVRYVSHCLGYPGEYGPASGSEADRPRQVAGP